MENVDNDALLAKMLWESENPYYDYGEDESDEDGCGYGSKKRRKAAPKASKKAAKKGSKQSPADAQSTQLLADRLNGSTAADGDAAAAAEAGSCGPREDGDVERTATGRRKRKDVGAKRGEKARAWDEEEERKYLEALDLYGRNWPKAAEHIGTRDARAVSSHAQKHLIKMCMAGQALPPKVAESGLGYTLSGKPLDPTSAAAKSYGFKPEGLLKLSGVSLRTALGGILVQNLVVEGLDLSSATAAAATAPTTAAEPPPHTGTPAAAASTAGQPDDTAAAAATSQPPPAAAGPTATTAAAVKTGDAARSEFAAAAAAAIEAAAAAAAVEAAKTAEATAAKDGAKRKAAKPPRDPAARPKRKPAADDDDDDVSATVTQPTEYALSRPRREHAGQRAATLGHTSESLNLVKCVDFMGPPASGAPQAQPYTVEMTTEVLLSMDFHSHLSSCEIIGLLGGTWDGARRHIAVLDMYACRRACGSDDTTSVELDAEAEVEARAAMEARGQRCVGWYHSHPVFEPSPSQKDMDNQRNYQALFRDGATKQEPFLGFILGPYDLQLPAPRTAVTAFMVQQKKGAAGLTPYNVRYVLKPFHAASLPAVQSCLLSLLDDFREDIGRVDLGEVWRPFTSLEGGQLVGAPITKLAKLELGLRHYLSKLDTTEVDRFLHYIFVHLQERWLLKLGLGSTPPLDSSAQEQRQADCAEQQQQEQQQGHRIASSETGDAVVNAGTKPLGRKSGPASCGDENAPPNDNLRESKAADVGLKQQGCAARPQLQCAAAL